MSINKQFKERFCTALEQMNWGADAYKKLGVSRNSFFSYKRGEKPHRNKIEILAMKLNVSADWLDGKSDKMKSEEFDDDIFLGARMELENHRAAWPTLSEAKKKIITGVVCIMFPNSSERVMRFIKREEEYS